MEKEQILTIILSIATSLLGSSVLTSLFNRRWERANKSSNILEEQYIKVIAPIYRELELNNDKGSMISNIGNIISDNFHLLPEQLLKKFKNITNNEQEFRILIFDFYTLLRNKLGYSKVKVSKTVKEKEKLLAHKKIVSSNAFFSLEILASCICILISIFELTRGTYKSFFTIQAIKKYFFVSFIIDIFIFIIIALYITVNKKKQKK